MILSKPRLRDLAITSVRTVGLLALLERQARVGLTVLMYHRVLPDDQCQSVPFPSLVMPVSAFRAQIERLSQRATVLPLGQALASPLLQESSRPLVAITFDDGYEDNCRLAAPIAEQFGLRLTLFVTTDFVGAGRSLWFDRAHALVASASHADRRSLLDANERLSSLRASATPTEWVQDMKGLGLAARERLLEELGRRVGPPAEAALGRPMSVDDLIRLDAAGHEIASHGTGHSIFTTLDDDELRRELCDSRDVLTEWLGKRPAGLAYPNGNHDARVVHFAKQAGYQWACTYQPRPFLDG